MSAVKLWLECWKNHAEELVHPIDEKCLQQKTTQVANSRHRQCVLFHVAVPSYGEELKARTGLFRRELGTMPFVGNIEKASIFLLMINPGVSWNDYVDRDQGLTTSLFVRNKRQELSTCFALETNMAQGWSPYYLNKIFGRLLKDYKGDNYEEARSFLAQNLAILELVPYFSQNVTLIDQLSLDQELESAKLARNAAKELAKNPNNLMISRWQRGEQRWNLEGTTRSVCRNGLSEGAKLALTARIDAHLKMPSRAD